MKLTGAAILVSRGTKVLQAAPAAYPYRSAAAEVGVKETETCHFWAGHFPEEIAGQYFVEARDADNEDAPVSAFARDQGVAYYDHDFLEYGWGKAGSILDLVRGYSYSDQWGTEFAQRSSAAGLQDVNFFVFITDSEIEHPRSIQGEGYWLHYLGTIEYRI